MSLMCAHEKVVNVFVNECALPCKQEDDSLEDLIPSFSLEDIMQEYQCESPPSVLSSTLDDPDSVMMWESDPMFCGEDTGKDSGKASLRKVFIDELELIDEIIQRDLSHDIVNSTAGPVTAPVQVAPPSGPPAAGSPANASPASAPPAAARSRRAKGAAPPAAGPPAAGPPAAGPPAAGPSAAGPPAAGPPAYAPPAAARSRRAKGAAPPAAGPPAAGPPPSGPPAAAPPAAASSRGARGVQQSSNKPSTTGTPPRRPLPRKGKALLIECDLEKPFSCEECLKTFSTKDYLRRHRKIHSEKGFRVCPVEGCHKRLSPQRNNLTRHLKGVHGEGAEIKRCDYNGCDYKNFREDKIREHMKCVHKGEEGILCNQKRNTTQNCKFYCYTEKMMQLHQAARHKLRQRKKK